MLTEVYVNETISIKLSDLLKLYYTVTYELDEIKPSSFKTFLKGDDSLEVEAFVESFQAKVSAIINKGRKKRLTLKKGLRYTKPARDDFIGEIMEELGYDKRRK